MGAVGWKITSIKSISYNENDALRPMSDFPANFTP
jgi:hypothetical protein